MRNNLFILFSLFFLSACSGGSGGGSTSSLPPIEKIDFTEIKTDLLVKWKKLEPYCACTSDMKWMFLGALSKEILTDRGYKLSDLRGKENLESLEKMLKEIEREI